VRQGGIIKSYSILCVYRQFVAAVVHESGVGCYTGCVFTGALAYADDVVLMQCALS